jgi:hypothetical protein
VKRLMDFVDQHHVVRRIAFFTLLLMTWESFQWAMHFAETTTKSGAEVGLIIAAVTGPVALLQKSVIELYNSARG